MEPKTGLIPIQEDFDFQLEDIQEVKGRPGILGIMRGVTFVPGGESRNGRFYPGDFWPYILRKGTELRRIMEDNTLFGTIGHVEKAKDDLVREGLASHYTKELWIDEQGRGMGTHYVLDTPAGRILYNITRAGSRLRTSTKGKGLFLPQKTDRGSDIPDKENFILERVDFVCDPGFLEAHPKLVRELQEALNINNHSGRLRHRMPETMNPSEALLQRYIAENKKLTIRLRETIQENRGLKQDLHGMSARLRKTSEMSESFIQNTGEIDEALTAYAELGSPEEIREAFSKMSALIRAYRDTGKTPAEVKEAFKTLDQCESFFKEFGSPQQIAEAFRNVQSVFARLGTPGEIQEALEAVLSFSRKNGSFPEIAEALSSSREVIQDTIDENLASQGVSIAKRYGVAPETVARMFAKTKDMTLVEEALSQVAEAASIDGRYIVESAPTRIPGGRSPLSITESRLTRMFGAMNSKAVPRIDGAL